jgi:hypothetical protein
LIRVDAGSTVVALAGIAGAISYSHMRTLAEQHGEVGWRARAFPLPVDGIELVASLLLLADQRPAPLRLAAVDRVGGGDRSERGVEHADQSSSQEATRWTRQEAASPTRLRRGAPADRSRSVATRSTRTTTTKTLVQDRSATGLHIGPDKALDVADLLPAVRAALSALTSQGRNLTRAAMTERLRAAGHTVSNVRASVLVKILSVDLS